MRALVPWQVVSSLGLRNTHPGGSRAPPPANCPGALLNVARRGQYGSSNGLRRHRGVYGTREIPGARRALGKVYTQGKPVRQYE